MAYPSSVPKLWEDTVENHRRAVRDAVLDAAGALFDQHGLRGLTMSRIATASGIGRATLYKYYPDLEAVLLAHHRRHVTSHLEQLSGLRNEPGEPADQLHALMRAYALISFHRGRHRGEDAFVLLHTDDETADAVAQVREVFAELIAATREADAVRGDVDVPELVDYCLSALSAAGGARDEAAVLRLVDVTTDGLRG